MGKFRLSIKKNYLKYGQENSVKGPRLSIFKIRTMWSRMYFWEQFCAIIIIYYDLLPPVIEHGIVQTLP